MAVEDDQGRKRAAAREMRDRCAALGGRIAETAQVNSALVFVGPIDIADGAVVYAPVEIGAFSYLNVGTVVFPHVRVGKYCSIGRNVQIGLAKHPTSFLSSHPFQFSSSLFAKVPGYTALQKEKWQFHSPTEIGSDVWIGAGAMISCGLKIGSGAVIGANAVVTRDVAPYEIVGGVPARTIRFRFEQTVIDELLASEWWDLPIESLAKIDFGNIEGAVMQLKEMRVQLGQA